MQACRVRRKWIQGSPERKTYQFRLYSPRPPPTKTGPYMASTPRVHFTEVDVSHGSAVVPCVSHDVQSIPTRFIMSVYAPARRAWRLLPSSAHCYGGFKMSCPLRCGDLTAEPAFGTIYSTCSHPTGKVWMPSIINHTTVATPSHPTLG